MSRDRSLDEFAETDTKDREGSDGRGDASDDEPEADEGSTDAGPTPTYGFEPGATCEDCGEGAETRYRDDGRWVCAACKDW